MNDDLIKTSFALVSVRGMRQCCADVLDAEVEKGD
jgi:hypothetical protein